MIIRQTVTFQIKDELIIVKPIGSDHTDIFEIKKLVELGDFETSAGIAAQ